MPRPARGAPVAALAASGPTTDKDSTLTPQWALPSRCHHALHETARSGHERRLTGAWSRKSDRGTTPVDESSHQRERGLGSNDNRIGRAAQTVPRNSPRIVGKERRLGCTAEWALERGERPFQDGALRPSAAKALLASATTTTGGPPSAAGLCGQGRSVVAGQRHHPPSARVGRFGFG